MTSFRYDFQAAIFILAWTFTILIKLQSAFVSISLFRKSDFINRSVIVVYSIKQDGFRTKIELVIALQILLGRLKKEPGLAAKCRHRNVVAILHLPDWLCVKIKGKQ